MSVVTKLLLLGIFILLIFIFIDANADDVGFLEPNVDKKENAWQCGFGCYFMMKVYEEKYNINVTREDFETCMDKCWDFWTNETIPENVNWSV